ncbi:MAG: RNA polymerase factor sigma-54 [Pseudomonadales bacterium]
MKQTLSLRLGQQLTMTPQLQQAIRLLQLSTLDLRQEIQTVLESNPMLELEDEYAEGPAGDADEAADDPVADAPDADGEATADGASEDYDGEGEDVAPDADTFADGADGEVGDSEWDQDIPEDLPVDTQWDDIYQSGSGSGSGAEDDWDQDGRNTAADSLQDHLRWQLNLTTMSDLDRAIGLAIIDAIDPDGMLTAPIEEILEGFDLLDNGDRVEADEVIAVLKRIQQFDPPGVAARDLGECLLLQLRALPASTPWLTEAQTLAGEHLDLLGSRDFAALKRKLKLDEDALAEVVQLIVSLNPRPGASISSVSAEYVVPDVLVQRRNGRWSVELNSDATPRLRINSTYASLIKRADTSRDNTFLKDNLQEARWFLKSLQSRNETLLKVATRIVEHQRAFLEYGEQAMKPLVLHDIAESVEMHESTISRVTNRKYMHTPRGIFELKYFFSSHVSTHSGGEVSSTAIRALIKKLTADENPRKPLSDSKIAAILAKQNINVARRTVAKYRESLSIPPSNERKRLV